MAFCRAGADGSACPHRATSGTNLSMDSMIGLDRPKTDARYYSDLPQNEDFDFPDPPLCRCEGTCIPVHAATTITSSLGSSLRQQWRGGVTARMLTAKGQILRRAEKPGFYPGYETPAGADEDDGAVS